MKNVNELVVAYINDVIEDKGITNAAIARDTGLSQPTIGRLLAGQTDLSLPRVYDFCDALDIEISDVLAYIEDNQKGGGAKKAATKPAASGKVISGKKAAARPTSAITAKTERYAAKVAGKTATKEAAPKAARKAVSAKAEKPVAGKRAGKIAAAASKPKLKQAGRAHRPM